MCGIVGYINLNGERVNQDEQFNLALSNLNKRGPDAQLIKHFDSCSLGHARLAIIDTSEFAHQPFSDDSENYWIIFNGEIFNFHQIKDRLKSMGIVFKTQSDTEVLLHLLIQKGKEALHELNGFYSFCFYDKKNNTYLIARDRFGVKPLVYVKGSNHILFSSEIKGILPFLKNKSINKKALSLYFQYSYIPESLTIFNSVEKLLPGHLIEIKNGQVEIQKYYEYYPSKVNYSGSYEKAQEGLHKLLTDAVEKRLISDVPIGSFLSGGVDSSIISLLASRHSPNLHTFSLGFKDEPYFDETKYANLVAKKINSKHTVFSLSNNDLLEYFEESLDYFDEPFADSSALNMFILSKYTKKHITVALSGDGADELFSGYNKHQALFQASQTSLKNALIKTFGGVANWIPQSRNGKIGNTARQILKFQKGLKLSDNERYMEWARFMDKNDSKQLVKGANSIKEIPFSFEKKSIENFNDYLFYDFNLVLPNDMLRKVDAMSMANSLEVRTPFLDYRLVEFVFSLPSSFKIDSQSRKKILKDTFRDDLPAEIFSRGKHGFEVPLYKWFNNELKSYLQEHVFNKQLIEGQNILNWDAVNHIEQQLFSSNPKDSVYNTWALLSFQRWYNRYFV
jgi:asparagine synthase (glutamine-hydrolysing)